MNSGQYITELCGGANLVDGKPTWEHAQEGKHDLERMRRCCAAELQTMKLAGIVAAPFYFERAAVLARKAKLPQLELDVCETYLRAVEEFYAGKELTRMADVRMGSFFQSLPARIAKARAQLDSHAPVTPDSGAKPRAGSN